MEHSIPKGESALPHETYSEHVEKARKEFPALIKRMSNSIPADQKDRLVDPDQTEFIPDFEYPNLFDLDEEKIKAKEIVIEENLLVARQMEENGYRPTVSEEFDKEKALNGLANLELLSITQSLQTCEADEKPALADRFLRLNESMVGGVDEELYQGVINSLRQIAAQVTDDQPIAGRIAEELTAMLPYAEGDKRIVSLPQDTFEQYSNAYEVIFGAWLREVIPEKEGLYDVTDIAEIFENALSSMKLNEHGWEVVIDEEATSMKISMEDKTITVPKKRKPMTYKEIAPKVVHEIGHITRGWNGSYISRAAEHGLPEYLDAEEGLMSFGEEFISGEPQTNSTYVERYLGAGMMSGSIDNTKKDFRQVFGAMWRARVLLDNEDVIAQGVDITKDSIKDAKTDSLMNAQRLFRGTDGREPGVGWTKDKAYYEGVAKLRDFLVDFADKVGVEHIYLLFTAKFDPTNSLHNRYLQLPLK